MATPLVVPSSALLKLNWTGPSRNFQNALGLRWAGAAVTVTQALTDAIFTAIKARSETTAMLALFGQNVTLASISLKDINSANLTEFTSGGAAIAGTGVGATLPLNDALCVTLRTASAGKSFRGRVYLSGWTQAQSDSNGRTLAAANTAGKNFIDGINTAVGASGFTLAVLSRNAAGKTIPQKVIPARAGFSTAVSATQVRNTKWESQRRRTGRT